MVKMIGLVRIVWCHLAYREIKEDLDLAQFVSPIFLRHPVYTFYLHMYICTSINTYAGQTCSEGRRLVNDGL